MNKSVCFGLGLPFLCKLTVLSFAEGELPIIKKNFYFLDFLRCTGTRTRFRWQSASHPRDQRPPAPACVGCIFFLVGFKVLRSAQLFVARMAIDVFSPGFTSKFSFIHFFSSPPPARRFYIMYGFLCVRASCFICSAALGQRWCGSRAPPLDVRTTLTMPLTQTRLRCEELVLLCEVRNRFCCCCCCCCGYQVPCRPVTFPRHNTAYDTYIICTTRAS